MIQEMKTHLEAFRSRTKRALKFKRVIYLDGVGFIVIEFGYDFPVIPINE